MRGEQNDGEKEGGWEKQRHSHSIDREGKCRKHQLTVSTAPEDTESPWVNRVNFRFHSEAPGSCEESHS